MSEVKPIDGDASSKRDDQESPVVQAGCKIRCCSHDRGLVCVQFADEPSGYGASID
jgi:hypothetical protein